MIYEIRTKNGFSTGAELTVRIPQEELDRKALYTIQAEKPRFVVPFHHKSIDGQSEFVYQTGALSKLQYISGRRSPGAYVELWQSILTPLLECADWFMKPYSFALLAAHLYYDKHTKAVSYIYIPSRRDCADYNDLQALAAELSRQISATDAELENKVLRAIMKDFEPKEFLRMLKDYLNGGASGPAPQPQPQPAPGSQPATPLSAPAAELKQPLPAAPVLPGEIVINIPPDGPAARKKSAKKGGPGGKKEQKPHKQKSGGLFGKKKSKKEPAAIILGAAAAPLPEHKELPPPPSAADLPAAFADVTQLIEEEAAGAKLRFSGRGALPREINVLAGEGMAFTIGRFDVNIGRPQSSFEFDKNTKAVSRRHAVIERDAEGYSIIDLCSSAGTFVDGCKLPPNIPQRLKHGSQVSFGNAGADYVWEGY